MKAKKLPKFKENYKFEAPIFPAAIRGGGNITSATISSVDLYSLLLPKSGNYFMVQVSGESMIEDNIYHGDILIVDKNSTPQDGQVVIASLNGEMLVKRYKVIEDKVYLFSANSRFLPIEIFPDWSFEIQGVVKHCIHDMAK